MQYTAHQAKYAPVPVTIGGCSGIFEPATRAGAYRDNIFLSIHVDLNSVFDDEQNVTRHHAHLVPDAKSEILSCNIDMFDAEDIHQILIVDDLNLYHDFNDKKFGEGQTTLLAAALRPRQVPFRLLRREALRRLRAQRVPLRRSRRRPARDNTAKDTPSNAFDFRYGDFNHFLEAKCELKCGDGQRVLLRLSHRRVEARLLCERGAKTRGGYVTGSQTSNGSS